MNNQTLNRTTFIINIISLLATTILFYLLIFKGIQLIFKSITIIILLSLIITTFFGLYISFRNQIKPLTTYYFIIFICPIILTVVSLVSGNGIIPIQFGSKFIFSTFESDFKLIEKDNVYIKRSFSLMSNQWYDVVEGEGLFEEKIGKFNSDENFKYIDFTLYDSINKKFIKLIDPKQTAIIEELTN